MADWLEGLLADSTTKDEFGQTQADRRQPVWDGLIKAGLLGIAAGQNLAPEQRAQMLAQVGGAVGDIGTAQQQGQAFAAQQTLRRQQMATNKTKLDNIARMQAMTKTQEFQDSIKDLKPHEKMAVQAAIDAGDLDAFTKITGQVGIGQHRERQLEIARERLGIQQDRLQLAQDKQDAVGAGGLQGNSEPIQMRRRLEAAVAKWRATGDTSVFETPAYQAAHDFFSKDRIGKGPNDENIRIPGQDIWQEGKGAFPPPYHNKPYVKPEGPVTPNQQVQVIPGGPKKALDKGEMGELSTGLTSLQTFDNVVDELANKPNIKIGNSWEGWAAGMAPEVGSAILNKLDPDGIGARAMIANIGSMIIKDRSGAAVSVHEMKRLAPFIPDPYKDSPEAIREKLSKLREGINLEMKLYYDNIKGGNRQVPPELEQRMRKIGNGGKVIPDAHISYLEQNPHAAVIKDFDAKYGEGAASRVLGR